MLTKLKNEFVLRICTFGQMLLTYCGVWFTGFLISSLLMIIKKPDSFVSMGVLFAMIFVTFYLILVYGMNYCIEFELSIKMSVPRKSFLIYNTICNLVSAVAYAAFIVLLTFVDKGLGILLFNKQDNKMVFLQKPLELFGIMLLLNIATIILGMVIGTLLQRYGKKAFWVLYGVYMAAIIGGMGLSISSNNPDSLMGRFGSAVSELTASVSVTAACVIGAIAAIIITVITVMAMLRATVKS